jgi:transcriptional regulator with XRE-family HTH domain
MISDFIRNQRTSKGYTQAWVADQLDVSRPTYIQIEQGKRDLLLSEAQHLAKIFDLSFENFVSEQLPQYQYKVTPNLAKPPDSPDIRISIPESKLAKFRQVLLYILHQVGGKPNVGMTVIYKLLYFIDFDYYERYEEQLMGLVYLKNHQGPTPQLFAREIKKMEIEGQLETIKSKYYKYDQKKFLINPDLKQDISLLSGQELQHIDWELGRLADKTAKELSDISHQDVPWITADNQGVIDYEAVFYRTHETSSRKYDNSD